MYRHLASFALILGITVALVDKVRDGESAPYQHSRLTVLSVHPIFDAEGSGTADMARFLAKVGHVERNASLALRFVQDFVHRVQQHHITEHFAHRRLIELGILRFILDHALAVHHAIDRQRFHGFR
uniref:Putative secreted protein n=1 Tax=Anopheles darlingi TaxID=43151 RepID=A0A2M4DR73_ANODA